MRMLTTSQPDLGLAGKAHSQTDTARSVLLGSTGMALGPLALLRYLARQSLLLLLQLLHHLLMVPLPLILLVQILQACQLKLHAHLLQFHCIVVFCLQGRGQLHGFLSRSVASLTLGGMTRLWGQ